MTGGMKFTAHIDSKRPDKVLKAIMKGIDWGAEKVKKTAKDKVPVDTGRLKKSIEIKKIKGGKSIGPDTPYDTYVEFGTGPHLIKPVRASVLHWVGKDGKDHFAKSVMHPGTRRQPYMRPAIQENRKDIARFTAKEIRKVLK